MRDLTIASTFEAKAPGEMVFLVIKQTMVDVIADKELGIILPHLEV